MRWKLGEIAKMEGRRGERTWIENRRIKIGDKRWRWDEEKKVLKDERGNIKKRKRGKRRESSEIKRSKKRRRKERREGWKAAFWNIAGLGNKDTKFWKGL